MRKIVFLLFLLCIGLASNAFPTIMIKQFSIEEMTHRSDTVVIGKVANIEYKTNDRNQIFTLITVDTTDVLKGDTQNTEFKVIEIGGKTDKYTTAVYGAPTYLKNEEVVLFLRDHIKKVDLKRVVALKQGKYSIVKDSKTGKRFAVTDLNDIEFAEPPTDTTADNDSDKDTGFHNNRKDIRIPLDKLISQIQEAVREETQIQPVQNVSSRQIKKQFDWSEWLRRKIVHYVNKMGSLYKTYVLDTQRS